MKSSKSYTLIELLIYITILAIALTMTVALIFNLTLVRAKNEVLSEVEGNIRFSLEKITQTVRNAKGINKANGSTLNLATFDGSTDPTIFSLTPEENLQVQEGTGTPKSLTTNKVKVSTLNFSKVDGPDPEKPATIAIEITIEHKSTGPEQRAKTTIKTTVSLRQ